MLLRWRRCAVATLFAGALVCAPAARAQQPAPGVDPSGAPGATPGLQGPPQPGILPSLSPAASDPGTTAVTPSLTPPSGGRVIEEITILTSGPVSVNREAILAHMSLREGSVMNQSQLDNSIRSLYLTGLYDFVEGLPEPLAGGGVRLVMTVQPKFRTAAVVFDGNKAITSTRLAEEITTKAGGTLDEFQVRRDTDKLIQFYQKRGYSKAEVTSTISRNPNTGTGVVTFNITEGPRIHISSIRFTGNEHVPSDTLRDIMETTTYKFFISWFSGGGRFEETVFQEDMDKLRAYYKNRGYLDVEIPDNEVVFEYPSPGSMRILITIREGRQYRIGNIKITGNTIFTTEQLTSILTIKTGDIFAPERVDENTNALRDFYGARGYIQAYVRAERQPNLETGNIDLTFVIVENEKFFVEGIIIQGNDKTRSSVIVRELALMPGDVFDTVRMKTSENRLKNTRFFDEVNLSPDDSTNIPGRRNLRITVKEGQTGSLTFGAGFSTIESVSGWVELSQSNFDIFNWKRKFQGGGQKARVRLSVGSASNQILLSFEEPWLWERELTGGINIFRTESNYLSVTFNETRMGFDVYLRKRLFELVEGTLAYTLQNIELSDVTLSAPPNVQNEAGNRSLSMGSFTLLRDTRDNVVFPTRGTRLELINDLAGGPFFGSTYFYRLEGRAGWWYPTFKFGNQVLSVVGRAGSVMPYGGNVVPYSESYFLGGPYNLRGYAFRNVGPRFVAPGNPASGQVVGGNTLVYFSPEYSIEVVNPVRFAVFYDFGYVNANAWDFDPSTYRHDIGIGFRILILGAPLRIDLGYPLNPDTYQSSSIQFNFSFGTVF